MPWVSLAARLNAWADRLLADPALDPKSRMFSQFDQELPGMLPGLKVNPLGWVGESLSIDLEQGFFWKALAEVGMDTDMLMKLPVVLRLESKSQLKLAAFLTGVRAAIESSAPDLVKWELRKHGEKSYVLIRGNEEDMPDEFVLCYYASSKALLISLDEDVLMRAMDRELAGADEAAAVPLGQARQVLMETRPDFMLDMGSMIEDVGMDERRQQESWKALPILNEWHRRFPNEDPVEFHQTVFGEDLFCPGGKGYRWNSEDLTIESVAYGHPAGPRNEGMPQPWIKKFGTLRAGLEFAEGGLRARLMAGPGRDPKPAAGASKRGPVLATAAELTPQKVGTIVRYRTTGPDGVETLSRTVSKVEETGEFIRIENESVHEVEGEKSHSKEIMRLGNDGVRYLETSDEESRTVYDLPEVDLPAELVAGADTTHPFSGTIIYQGEDSDEDRCFGEYRIRIIGLEAVEVPAGKYDSCIRMESVWMGVSGGYYSDLKYVGWYAKGVGLVKYETRSGGERQVTEMVEYSEGGGP